MEAVTEATPRTHENESLFDAQDFAHLMGIVKRYQDTCQDFMLVVAGTEVSKQTPMHLFSVSIQNNNLHLSDEDTQSVRQEINQLRNQVVSEVTTSRVEAGKATIWMGNNKILYFNQVFPHCSCLGTVVLECGAWLPHLGTKKQRWLLEAVNSEFFQSWSPVK